MAEVIPNKIAATALSTTTALIQAVATATVAAVSHNEKGSKPDAENGECQLLGPFAIVIQGALGVLALSSLVFKRWRERPQRPIKIWAFDVSKQVVGSILLHLVNLLMSMFSIGDLKTVTTGSVPYKANPCSLYFLNLAIDTTLGVPILILLLKVLTIGILKLHIVNPPESIRSGNYGHPPKTVWWLKQSLIYFIGLLGMKLFVLFIFKICPWIVYVGDWALRWTEGDENLQVFFVMLFFPLVMNALQYYIIDGFIKNKKPSEHEEIPTEEEDARDAEASQHLTNAWDASFDSEDEVGPLKKPAKIGTKIPSDRGPKLRVKPDELDEYDPEQDGESSEGAVGSSNSIDKNEDHSSLGSRKP